MGMIAHQIFEAPWSWFQREGGLPGTAGARTGLLLGGRLILRLAAGELVLPEYSWLDPDRQEWLSLHLESGRLLLADAAPPRGPAATRELDELAVGVLLAAFPPGAPPADPAYRQAALDFVLRHLAREEAPAPAGPVPEEDLLARALAHLRDHAGEPLRIKELAAALGVSAARLHRAFRGGGHESPLKALTRLRMDRARRLLEQSPLPVAQVAREAGFGDTAAFSHCFKRQTGLSPAAYRRQIGWLV